MRVWVWAGAVALLGGCGGTVTKDEPPGAGGSGMGGSGFGGSGFGGSGVGGSGFGGSGGSGFGGSGIGGGGTGGIGGSGGAISNRLGRACATDAECGNALFCVTANSGMFGQAGPAKGYCSLKCTADQTVCSQLEPGAMCMPFASGAWFCMEGCAIGPDSLTQFDPNKCHGRPEVACTPVAGQGVCLPNCNHDLDCGVGLFCHPDDGLCRPTPPVGKTTGAECTIQSDGSDDCQGNCTPLGSPSGAPLTNVCSGNCTFGALPSCGWEGPSSGLPAPATCLFAPGAVIDLGGPGVGDIGSCGQLCNCNSECANTKLVCTPFTSPQFEQFFQKKGYCSVPDGSPSLPCN